MRLVPAILVLAGFLSAVPAARAQCALCRAAVESSEEGRAMAVKLNRGILLLLGAPLGVGAAVGAALYRSRRQLEWGHGGKSSSARER
jgi:hypothetical protein